MPSYNSAALLGGGYLEKGSTAAKARMAYLRSLRRGKRTTGGAICCGGKRSLRSMRGGGPAEAVFGLVGKALGFWGNWGKTNIGQLVTYIKNKKQRQKVIDAIKKLSPAERKKFQAMMRQQRDKGLTTEQILAQDPTQPAKPAPPPPAPIQQKSEVELAKEAALRELEEAKKERDRRLLEIMNKRFERSKRPKKNQIISQTLDDDYDYDEHQPDNVGEMEDMIDDTSDMAYNPRYARGGKMSGRDIGDIFLGPWGWAALISRKIQEKKEKKQKAELDKLMYGDEK